METLFVRQVQPPIINTGSTYGCACNDFGPVRQIAHTFPGGEFSSHPFPKQKYFCAETFSLLERPFGEFRPANASWETKVVFDFWTCPGLSTHRKALDNDGLQAFGSSVHSCAQSGRARAIDGEVVLRLGRV